jgi:YD repeat-containing protein
MLSESVFRCRWVRLFFCMMLVAGRSWFAVAALFIAAAPAAWSATSNFVYDEAGRLVEVIAPSGDTARYVYDAAGNIKQIRRSAAAALSLAEFSPNQGAVGSSVALYGSGFNPVLANNTVRFGGVAATVSSATPNQLIVAVPAGAVTGPVAVTVGAATVTSAQPYTVLPAAAGLPSIAGFAPTNGGTGTAVTLTGSGFDSDRSKLLVTLNGRPVAVTASTATSIELMVGPEATTGRFEVITPMGRATSAADFFVPPAGDSNDGITQRVRMVVDGPSLVISSLAHNKVALVAFDGIAGQRMAIGAHNLSSSPVGGSATVSVTAPNGKVLFSCAEVWTSGRQCVVPKLPVAGTYLIRTKATASGGSVSLTLTASSDLVIAVPVDGGTPSVFTVTRPGQRARAVFAAEAGRRYTVAATEQTVPGPAQFEARAADGRLLGSMAVSPAPAALQGLDISAGPIAGPVQVTIDPSIGGTGRIGWIVQSDVTGTLSPGGSPVSLSLTSGRNARLVFAGSAGQFLSLGYTGLAVVPPGGGATVVLKVNDPTGTLVHACNVFSSSASESCALPVLRADGEHSVTVETQGTVSASLALSLNSDVSGTLSVDAPSSTTFTATRAGQNGRYQFAGVAGQRYAVLASGVTVAGGATLRALDPAGNPLGSTTITPASLPSLDVGPLSTTGTYTVVVDPYQAQTGQVGLRVVSDVAPSSLAIDGAGKAVALGSGQNARMTFNGIAGRRIGIGLASLATSPAGGSVKVSVLKPDGSALHQCKFGGGYTAPDNCALPPLLTTGVHTLVIDPQLTHGASLTVWASTPVSGAISVDAASPQVFATTRPGQNGQYVFAGLAGRRYSVVASSSTIAGASTVTISSPSGAAVATGGVTGGGAPAVLDLPALVEGGACTVTVNTAGASTGQLELRVVSEPTPTLAVDGAALPMALLPGQNGRAGFTGTAGQRLGLGLTGMSTVPAGGAITVRVVGPTGLDWFTCSTYATSNPAGSCNLPALPASGTYQVVVDPLGGNSAQATLTLSSDIQSSLVVNPAAPTTFTTSRFGQNGRYTFEATAGGNYTVSFSGITIPGTSTAFTLLKPDGVQLAATFGGAGMAAPPIVANNVPVTGTYTVLIDPVAGAVGSASLRVDQTGTTPPAAQTPQGSIAIDGAATALAVPAGQTYRYTFSGSQGQYVSLGFTAAATSPAGASPTMWVTRPDNTSTLAHCLFAAGNFACDLPALPSTGTYTLRVQAPSSASMSGNVIASTATAGVLTIDAASPTTVATPRAGQQARYSFAGTAGDRLNMAITGGAYPGGTSYQLIVQRPDGGVHAGMVFSPGATTNVLDLPELPATGNYTVLGDPSGAATGQVSLQLRRFAAGALTVDGTATSISLAQGNDGRYTFSATSGQVLSLGFPTLTIAPATGPVIVRVLGPDGGLHTNCYGGNGPFACALAPVVRTGSYVVVLEAPTGGVVTGVLSVSNAAGGTLTADGAT